MKSDILKFLKTLVKDAEPKRQKKLNKFFKELVNSIDSEKQKKLTPMLDDVKEVYYVTPFIEGDDLLFEIFLIPEKYHPEKYESSIDFIDNSDLFEEDSDYYGEHCRSSELTLMALDELQENHPEVLRYSDKINRGYTMYDMGPYLKYECPCTYKEYSSYMSEIDEADTYYGRQYARTTYRTDAFRNALKRAYPDYNLCFLNLIGKEITNIFTVIYL